MRTYSTNFSFLLIRDIAYINFRKLNTRVKHFPIITKVSGKQSKKSKLHCHHNNSFRIPLRSNKLINTHDSSNIINIAEDDDIVFKAIFFSNL